VIELINTNQLDNLWMYIAGNYKNTWHVREKILKEMALETLEFIPKSRVAEAFERVQATSLNYIRYEREHYTMPRRDMGT